MFRNFLLQYTLAVWVLLFVGISDSKEADVSSLKFYKTKEGCICYLIYKPICGTDGKTYGNDCELACAQRNGHYVLGVCNGECPCCKPPYHNEPYPYDIPQVVDSDAANTGGGWGWNQVPSRWGMGFPYWNRVHRRSPPHPVQVMPVPVQKGSHLIHIAAPNSGKINDENMDLTAVPSRETIVQSAKSDSVPVSEEVEHVRHIEFEESLNSMKSDEENELQSLIKDTAVNQNVIEVTTD